MKKLLSFKIIVITIVIVIIAVLGIVFFLVQPQKTISPVSSNPLENRAIEVLEKQPSKTLKNYTDDAGFSFKYPEDVVVTKKDANDPNTYSHLEITSSKTQGSISIKIADTKVKSLDDWFKENKLTQSLKTKKDIKIGEISGLQALVDGKLLASAVDQDILFRIEVDSQNQKYWQIVYETILSSFNFVPRETTDIATQSLDDSNSDVVLEEETVE